MKNWVIIVSAVVLFVLFFLLIGLVATGNMNELAETIESMLDSLRKALFG